MTTKTNIINDLKSELKLSDNQINQLQEYFKTLITTNETLNLTAITEEDEVWEKHFYDSLTPVIYFPKLFSSDAKLADIGTGAGFPGLAIKIAKPKIKVTLVDSLNKRLNFLNNVIEELKLEEIRTVHARAEDFGQNSEYREKFNLVTARAVANTSTLLEYLLPATKVGGSVILFKTATWNTEFDEASKALQTLGGELGEVKEFTLPNGDHRALIQIRKIKPTPKKYPRQAGTPLKNPIR